jgi:chaperonin GroES
MDDEELKARTFFPTQFGTYMMVQWTGRNESRIRALCDMVLVLPDQPADMAGSIVIPDSVKETTGAAATTGVLISCGPQAFAYDSGRQVRWEGERPKPGDRIYFQKYAGQEHRGRDGLMYRLMVDKSIAGMEEPEPTEM